ncbi:methionyl-tRNA synthetase [Metarhizium album ARSEF 1941]|uniref:Probable methionine--tRNA ligase, mitochondrial n=1 Tax=Metarhizium album (strain ARSEF 1941) TaxID=1081103 RepID=A0A0B2WRJ1_METAS|nr:methionyl-tRNA synthetase [Metarhizium album ARSEF 1941]KHN95600.1 methionyl-tRNA synthetase [Metarhizium album ARSEF 1941]
MVLADVLKRWQQLKGKKTFLLTGTDEHGMKIQRAAAKEGIPPKEFCDSNSNKFRELAAAGDISYDAFIRTTQVEHKEAVSEFWLKLKHTLPENLGLYKGTHEGWYAVSDECFYPEDLVRPDIVPQTGKKIMVSDETGSEVEWIKEETWFFPLTKYRDALLKFYDENPHWITPTYRMNEVRNWVENHLEDLCITRPAARLSWGIPDPEDRTQTIYVWVDALINYLTQAGYGRKWHSPPDEMGIWPADVQIIGKDILRFHAVYWPALLMALDLPLPKQLLCHNHWTMSNRKMSKSLGNVVNPFFAMQRWDIDPLRYFLMRNGSLAKDMSYSNQLIGSIYAKELQANIGNLFYRIARPKVTSKWSTLEAVTAFRNGAFKGISDHASHQLFVSLDEHMEKITPAFSEEMKKYNTAGAVREVFDLLRETNRYVSDTEPWNLVKKSDPQIRILLNLVIYNCAEALRIAGILLQPIMPTKASLLLDELAVRQDRRTLKYASKGKDADYGTEAKTGDPTARLKKWDTIFPPTPNSNDSDAEVMEQLRLAFYDKTKNRMNQVAELLAMEARIGEEAATKMLTEMHAAKLKRRQVEQADDVALQRLTRPRHQYEQGGVGAAVQEATASEPLTLEEEYENQQSWRSAHEKLTFIICQALPAAARTWPSVEAKVVDAGDRMIGDINFFIYQDDEPEETSQDRRAKVALRGEIDVMIANKEHRGQGFGSASVRALLMYLRKNMEPILKEYACGLTLGQGVEMVGLMVKIQEGNTGSRRLFEKLGFEQVGDVNYFGEVMLVLPWGKAESLVDGWLSSGEAYREVRYETS